MVEVAKSIKVHAFFVMAVSAAMAAFIVSPKTSITHHKTAKSELEALQTIDRLREEYRTFFRTKLNEQRFHPVQEAMTPTVPMAHIRSIAPPIGLTFGCGTCSPTFAANAAAPVETAKPANGGILPADSLSLPVEAPRPAAGNEIEIVEHLVDGSRKSTKHEISNSTFMVKEPASSCFNTWGNSLPFEPNFPPSTATISEYRHFLMKHNSAVEDSEEARIFIPHLVEFAENFRALLKHASSDRLIEWKLTLLPNEPSPPVTVIGGLQSYPKCRLMGFFETDEKKTRTLCTTVSGEWKCGPCNAVYIKPFVDWCLARSELTDEKKLALFLNTTAGRHWLPATSRIWSEVSNKSIDEGITTLEGLIVKETDNISFFGQSVNGVYASIVFPLIVSVALFINLIQLKHLKTHLNGTPKDFEEIRSQWFGFIDAWESRILIVVLLVVVPFAIWLSLNPPLSNNKFLTRTDWIILVFFVSSGLMMIRVSIWHASLLDDFRKFLASKISPPAASPNDVTTVANIVDKNGVD